MDNFEDHKQELKKFREELADIEFKRQQLLHKISKVESIQSSSVDGLTNQIVINNYSSIQGKIKLYRSLFRGREDVYPRRFESIKTGKSGYQPACRNEWVRGICGKPKVKHSNYCKGNS